jgi:hypothetical protein
MQFPQPSPSGLHALRGGSARRRFEGMRPNSAASWSPRPVYGQNLAIPFRGYHDKPLPTYPAPPLALPLHVPEVNPVFFGHDGPAGAQRHRQPCRSSFQCPSPRPALRSSSLFTSGSPRYSATLGKRAFAASPRRAHRPASSPRRPGSAASADPQYGNTPRQHSPSRPSSAITSLWLLDSELPSSPRARFYHGCMPIVL